MEWRWKEVVIEIYLITVILQIVAKADNIALGKPATQLGTWRDHVAGRAVDGGTKQDIEDGSCAHPWSRDPTLRADVWGSPAWWSVDLAAGDENMTFVITSVEIYFRKYHLPNRNSNNSILVGVDPFWWNQTECAYINSTDIHQTIPCTPDTPLRYLTIRHAYETDLTFCEVMVSGYEYKPCPKGKWGEGCTSDCDCLYSCNDISKVCKGCDDGYFGFGCNDTCNCKNITEVCSYIDGSCASGCQDGFASLNCSLLYEPTGASGSRRASIIAGATVAAAILIIICIIIACILIKRSKKKMPKPVPSENNVMEEHKSDNTIEKTTNWGIQEMSSKLVEETPSETSTPSESAQSSPKLERHENIYDNTGLMPAIKVQDLGKYIQTKKNQTDAFKAEFKSLPIGPTAKWDIGNTPENKVKNRFQNTKAYDHSRVILAKIGKDPYSDYINANYINGYGGIQKYYIATQGPKDITINDTWRMVWDSNSNRIIMLSNIVEAGKIKCHQYWPDSGSALYGQIKVTLVSKNNYAAYVIRIFNIKFEGKSRRVHQFHFTGWPDHGVPKVATELLEFRRRVKSHDADATGPLIVHCSAGVGRTGTYIAIDYCLQQGLLENEVNIWGYVFQLRTERVNMVQTLSQYIFVYDALHEALLSGETGVQASQFGKEYARLCKPDRKTGNRLIEKQFEVLEILKTHHEEGASLVALEAINEDKNRYKDIIPGNTSIPYLSTMVEGTTGYINAVFVDSFRSKQACIATQMPLRHTVSDLWRLLYDHHSSTVVMLDPLDKNNEDISCYWPEEKEQMLEFGPLQVSLTSVDTKDPHITIRDFQISKIEAKVASNVRQFQFTSWAKEDKCPKDKGVLLQLNDMVQKWQQQTGNGPITVHCIDGATRCGLYLASLYAVEQLKVDQEVDVFRAVKQVRIPRPQFITDIDQYKFVHQMVLEYIVGFSEYSNFS